LYVFIRKKTTTYTIHPYRESVPNITKTLFKNDSYSDGLLKPVFLSTSTKLSFNINYFAKTLRIKD